MASYHCTVKAGASASASAHANYIERDGKYKTKDRDDLEAVESGNLPEWAERSGDFWQASDQNERANAKGYREYEVALPRELSPAQRLVLVREFVAQELGDRHAYTFAIHNPRAALEGGEQPHAHIMFSERHRDGIDRAPDQYFKRYNAKNPEKGGCRKGEGAKTPTERKADLIALRERWATLQNRHLEKHGHADRVDHRTLKAQGIEQLPTEHLGPKAAAMEKRGHATRRGLARAQRRTDIAELGRIPQLEQRIQVERAELAKHQLARLEEIGKPEARPAKRPELPTLQQYRGQQAAQSPRAESAPPVASTADRAELESKAVQVVAGWGRLLETERVEHLRELTAKAVQAVKAHVVQFQAHIDAEPKLFGRKEWQARHKALEDRDHRLRMAHSDLKSGRYPFLEQEKEAVKQAVLQRATAKQPQLAAAQAPAETVLREKARREQGERMEKARAAYQDKQARKAEKGRDEGYSR